ncbi:S41 family peptidase [Chryseomicrobium sp. FSL W7-1435]|uniref:S41 family peptidase n=1 Tax=Chryseomicrobium sp. FSL W7-1435 TaxID=2921704 RepID=UPI00315A5F4E
MRRRLLLLSLLVVLLITACDTTNQQPAVADSNDLLKEVRQLIKRHSIYNVSDKQLTTGALKGMVEAQHDPYSSFFTAEESILQRSRLAKERVGIGFHIMQQGERFIIAEVVPGTSAAEENLQPGDELVAVNQVAVKGLSVEQLVHQLSGKEGTTVTLKVLSKVDQQLHDIQLERRKLPQHTLTASTLESKDQSYGYISLSVFGEGTAEEWQQALQLFEKKGIEGLIIDVRGNPGGYLGSVVPILEDLLGPGIPLLWMENAKGELEWMKSEREAVYTGPVVVLQDSHSASASEVMLAALLESERAISVGRTTFGKGTVQETFTFKNESSLKLSTKKWLTPRKKWIQGTGVAPIIETKQPALSDLKQVPVTETEWQNFYKILALVGFSSDSSQGSNTNPILSFQHHMNLPQTGQVDSAFVIHLRERYKSWLKQEDNDEAIQLALDYFSHSQ